MFASAYPLMPLKESSEYYMNSGIKEEILPKIMLQNAVAFFGIGIASSHKTAILQKPATFFASLAFFLQLYHSNTNSKFLYCSPSAQFYSRCINE